MNDSFANKPQGSFAPLKNVALLAALAQRLIHRGEFLPGIGLFAGYSGYGKTMAALYCENKTGAVRIEIGESWTAHTMMQAILKELGVQHPRGTLSSLVGQAIERLGEPRHPPLIVDEADKAVNASGKMIEILREIHEHSRVPLILIGEEALPAKLVRFERVDNRVLETVLAQPCDFEDTRQLATLFGTGVTMADDLIEKIRRACDGRARWIVTTIDMIRDFAARTGITELNAATYTGGFHDGRPPRRS